MEKIINVGGKDVKLKSSAAFAIIYKSQFRRDPLADIMQLAKVVSKMDLKKIAANKDIIEDMGDDGEGKEIELLGVLEGLPGGLDTEMFYNFTWALAKAADKDIPEPIEFFGQFESFPIFDNLEDTLGLALTSMNVSVQPKKK